MTDDLRRHPRFSVDVQANVRTSDGRKLPARTRDLSRSGICLITTNSLAQREELLIDLILLIGPSSTSEPLPLRARVVWCTPISRAFQVGAMFERLTKKEQSFLEMFLRYLDGTILPAGAVVASLDDPSEAEAAKNTPEIKDDPFRR
jgi:Tfp pilus assembly protein PilZ